MTSAFDKIIEAILGALDLFRFWVVLYEYERGLILRLGKFHHELGPGIHWRWPFKIDELRFENIRPKPGGAWELTNTTACGKTVTTAFTHVIAVKDVKKVLLEVDDWRNVGYRLANIAVAESLAAATLEQILGVHFPFICRSAVEKKLEKYGIRVLEFELTERAATRAYRLFNGPR